MKQNIAQYLSQALDKLKKQGELPADLDAKIQVENTRDKKFGDFSSNIAMVLAKSLGKKPQELAQQIIFALPQTEKIHQATVAGPGFINFFVNENSFLNTINNILNQQQAYGRSQIGSGEKILVEFVSTNPNGPLHVGHGRGAAYGATVANLLEATGFDVHREYYVNDAGRQMDIVTVSIWLRYLELFGKQLPFPVAGYKGDYVNDIAKILKIKYDKQFYIDSEKIFNNLPKDAKDPDSEQKEIYIDVLVARTKELLGEKNYKTIFAEGLEYILADIRSDLAAFGVTFQTWFHESSLFKSGELQRGIEMLRKGGYLYEKNGATWFRSSDFGDEKDRVVIRENKTPTYFASDIAYHLSKFERGFSRAIDIFGSDHHGYAPRVRAFLKAVNIDPNRLCVLLVQFAILYRGKERVSMSTRGGTFVTLRELREEVGNDAARFFYVMRKPEQHLDFDLELAKAQSVDNPVYYIQYAYARVCSVFRQMEVKEFNWDKKNGLNHLELLTTDNEKALIQKLSEYPELIERAALSYAPHLLVHYLQELANLFHAYYNSEQFLVPDNNLRDARLCLICATQQVIFNGLTLLGVSSPEVM